MCVYTFLAIVPEESSNWQAESPRAILKISPLARYVSHPTACICTSCSYITVNEVDFIQSIAIARL